jgi:hypothetical protein
MGRSELPLRLETDQVVLEPAVGNCAVHEDCNYPFSRKRCDKLLGQLFNLGVESHDELVEALVWLV